MKTLLVTIAIIAGSFLSLSATAQNNQFYEFSGVCSDSGEVYATLRNQYDQIITQSFSTMAYINSMPYNGLVEIWQNSRGDKHTVIFHVKDANQRCVVLSTSLFKSSSSGLGWLCRVEVFVTGKGVTFEVKSDFKDKKPIDAAAACLENVKNAVSSR